MSFKHRIENLYPIMILLMARLLTHIHQLPPFFGVSKAWTSYGLKLSRISLFKTIFLFSPLISPFILDSSYNEVNSYD